MQTLLSVLQDHGLLEADITHLYHLLHHNAMDCKHCGSSSTRKNGKTKAGFQRYVCKDCKKPFTDSPNIWGSLPIGDRPMTGAERYAKWYAKHKKAK